MKSSLAEKIKSAREGLGLTQTRLAEKANIAQSIISDVEQGGRMPRIDTLIKIAKALDTTVSELLEEEIA